MLVSALLTLGLLATQWVSIEQRYEAIILLSGVSVLLSGWALLGDLHGSVWLSVLTLPGMYPASVGLFYFLLPANLLTRGFLLGLFGLGMYALLLTENIYSVAANRTIQLVRAANAVGFLITITTAIFITGTLFSFKLPLWANALVTTAALFPLFIQGLWSVTLSQVIIRRIWIEGLWLSLVGGELAAVIGLLPMVPLVSAIFMSGYVYVVLGLCQQNHQKRLFAKTIREYLMVGLVVIAASLFVTYW